jgi:hypothetical protein
VASVHPKRGERLGTLFRQITWEAEPPGAGSCS